jgi:hypothetical protein
MTVSRDCPNCPDPCKDRHGKIWDLLYRVRDAAGGTKGLIYRFAEQIATGAQGPGTSVWKGHEQAFYNDRRALRTEVNRYKNTRTENENGGKDPCPDTPLIAEAEAWANKPAPTAAEWEANNPQGPSTLARIGWGALGVLGVVATGVAIVSPFDGPAGDIALGAATAAAWQRAFATAGAVAVATGN